MQKTSFYPYSYFIMKHLWIKFVGLWYISNLYLQNKSRNLWAQRNTYSRMRAFKSSL